MAGRWLDLLKQFGKTPPNKTIIYDASDTWRESIKTVVQKGDWQTVEFTGFRADVTMKIVWQFALILAERQEMTVQRNAVQRLSRKKYYWCQTIHEWYKSFRWSSPESSLCLAWQAHWSKGTRQGTQSGPINILVTFMFETDSSARRAQVLVGRDGEVSKSTRPLPFTMDMRTRRTYTGPPVGSVCWTVHSS